MTTRVISLRRGKNGDTQAFSLARPADSSAVTLLEETLGPAINSSRRHQILGDSSNVYQFACLWGTSVGYLTRPTIVTGVNGEAVVTGNFTDAIGEPYPVAIPLEAFQSYVTTLIRQGDATTFQLAVHPTTPDVVAGPPLVIPVADRRGRLPEPEVVEGTLERLGFPMPDNPGADDHPVIAAIPLFLPVGPGQTFPHLVALSDPTSFRDSFPLFEAWKTGIAYLQDHNEGISVTRGGPLFDQGSLALPDGEEDPFGMYTIRERLLMNPESLAPTQPLYAATRDQLVAWSNTIWAELGASMEPEVTPPSSGGGGFTPEHFRAAMEPLVNKAEKTFGSAERTTARYRLLLAAAPAADSATPGRTVLPDLLVEFKDYLSKSSSATAGEDLKELVKSCLTLTGSSRAALDKDVTLEAENITLSFSDRVRTFTWLVEKLVSTSLPSARSVLGLLQFLTPDREALGIVAQGDQEAVTLLMSNSTSSTAQLDASKASKLYSTGRLETFRHCYEAIVNLRLLFSVMVVDLERPMVLVKLLAYVDLLVDRQGRLFFEAYRHSPHLAIHPYQDLQAILSAFLRVASNSSLYGAVIRGDHVSYSNYQTAIDVSDVLISDLRAILNGNGMGKFEGVPSSASWFTPASPGPRPGRVSGNEGDAAPKRQKVQDPAEHERRKGLGILQFDASVAGTNRLPTINVYTKMKGAKTPERLCMNFLTRGYSCDKADCKFPHVTNVETLPELIKAKFVAFVKKQPGLAWVEGRAPSGTSS